MIEDLSGKNLFFLEVFNVDVRIISRSLGTSCITMIGSEVSERKMIHYLSAVNLSFSFRTRAGTGIVWKLRTQDPENFDEEVKSLLTA